jgi:PadR family transcriptional regulator PadR
LEQRPKFGAKVLISALIRDFALTQEPKAPFSIQCMESWKAALSRIQLGEFERCVLIAVADLRGQGYAVSIAAEVGRRLGRSVSLGAIYATVDRLEKKGFVTSKLGDPTPERGGKPKRLYTVQAPGLHALSKTREIENRVWATELPIGVF